MPKSHMRRGVVPLSLSIPSDTLLQVNTWTSQQLLTAGWTKKKTLIAISLIVALLVCILLLNRSSQSNPPSSLRLPTGQGVPAISMGDSHGLILASDGSLWSWGTNFAGWPVLGLGNMAPQSKLHQIGQDTDWVDIATSSDFSLALKSDGTLWGWGQNIYYQLGDGTKTTRRTPIRSVAGNDWKQVAAGGASSFALKKDGTLWAWGDNWAGDLGIGTTTASREAVQIGSQTNWTKVWAAGPQTLALQSDGSLWFWGTLTGSSSDTNRFLIPTRVSTDTNWIDVGFGYFVIFAIKADGTLWAWGRNAGIYTGKPIQLVNETPVQVGTNNDWLACSSSEYFYRVFRKKDRSLWSMDASDYAFVNKASYKPVQLKRIDLSKDIVAFGAAGRGVTGVALTRDGEVWTWGHVLGEQTSGYPALGSLAMRLGWKTDLFNGKPVTRERPWQLNHE